MSVYKNGRRIVLAAVAALGLLLPVVANAQGTPAQGGGAPSRDQQIALARASLKEKLGFTDAQTDAFLKKVEAIAMVYRPKLIAMQKSYGPSPTPDQVKKMQLAMLPLIKEMRAKDDAALLSVATPAQRGKIQKQIEAEAKILKAHEDQLKASKP